MAFTKNVRVINQETGEVLIESGRWCTNRICKLIGLQFRRQLNPGEALILESSSIHMFFVFFPIAAIWFNSKGKVTSAQLAKPWRPYYASQEPARYVLETSPKFLEKISIGDELEFVQIGGEKVS